MPISTQEHVANFLTKALAQPKFKEFISKFGMIDIYHSQTWGRVLNDNILKDEKSVKQEECMVKWWQ